MDKTMLNDFEQDVLKLIPGFNVFNFYAVEILESAGFTCPKQGAIDMVEEILKDNSIGVDDYSPVQYLINKTKPNIGRALLFENNLFLLKTRYILLSNKGYSVDTAETLREFDIISKYRHADYSVIGFYHHLYKRTSLKFI